MPKYFYEHPGGVESVMLSAKQATAWRKNNPELSLVTESKASADMKGAHAEAKRGQRVEEKVNMRKAVLALISQANQDRLQGKNLVEPLDQVVDQWLQAQQ